MMASAITVAMPAPPLPSSRLERRPPQSMFWKKMRNTISPKNAITPAITKPTIAMPTATPRRRFPPPVRKRSANKITSGVHATTAIGKSAA